MTGRIVYVVPDVHTPAGGIRMMYRHVQVLNHLERERAMVWHYTEGYVPGWFASTVPTVYGETIILGEDDILVIPEIFVFPQFDPAPGCRKVIYNQNHFYTFVQADADRYPIWSPRPIVWVSSVTSQRVLQRLIDTLHVAAVENIPCVVDADMFRPQGVRKKKISWMPRKRPNEAKLIQALLASANHMADIKLTVIDGLDEKDTAKELANTSVFIALGHEEGFGLPVAEALAAGCVVVGYPSGGGAELFEAPGTHRISDSDVLKVVDVVAGLLTNEPSEQERDTYRQWIKNRYSENALSENLQQAIRKASEQPGRAGTARHPWPKYRAIQRYNDAPRVDK